MRMQHCNRAGDALELFVILTECFQRTPATLDDHVIHLPLVLPCQSPELFGNRKGDQKIIGGNLFFELPFQPLLALMRLAMRTVPMPAGMRYILVMITVSAANQHLWALRRTTDAGGR